MPPLGLPIMPTRGQADSVTSETHAVCNLRYGFDKNFPSLAVSISAGGVKASASYDAADISCRKRDNVQDQ